MKEDKIDYYLVNKFKQLFEQCDQMKRDIRRATDKRIYKSADSSQKFQATFNELFYHCKLKDTKYETLMEPYWLKAPKTLIYPNGYLQTRANFLLEEEVDHIVLILKQIKNDYCPQCVERIFISHAHDDEKIVVAFVEMLQSIGLTNKEIFCSSVKGYDVVQGKDIYNFLRNELLNEDVFVLFMLSENYYKSIASLNEMGAAWVLSRDYQSVLLPNYKFENVKGAINPMAKNFHINDEAELNILKNRIAAWFNLTVEETKWQEAVAIFLNVANK